MSMSLREAGLLSYDELKEQGLQREADLLNGALGSGLTLEAHAVLWFALSELAACRATGLSPERVAELAKAENPDICEKCIFYRDGVHDEETCYMCVNAPNLQELFEAKEV